MSRRLLLYFTSPLGDFEPQTQYPSVTCPGGSSTSPLRLQTLRHKRRDRRSITGVRYSEALLVLDAFYFRYCLFFNTTARFDLAFQTWLAVRAAHTPPGLCKGGVPAGGDQFPAMWVANKSEVRRLVGNLRIKRLVCGVVACLLLPSRAVNLSFEFVKT